MSGRSLNAGWNPPTTAWAEIGDPGRPDPGGATAHRTACRVARLHHIVADSSAFVNGGQPS